VKPLPFRKREVPPHDTRRIAPTYDISAEVDRKSESQQVDARAPIQEALRALDTSVLVFRCPAEMTLGSTQTVSAALTENADGVFRRELQSRGLTPEHVSTSIEVLLSPDAANAFDIVAQDSGGGTGWAWRVKPKQLGRHVLTLKARFTAAFADKTFERVFPPLSQTVAVDEDRAAEITGVMRGVWVWIAPLALLALLLVFLRHRTRLAS
jgi:hypothetical protein